MPEGAAAFDGDLAITRATLTAMLSHVDEAIVATDEAGVVRFASAGVRALLGLDPDAVVGRNLLDFLHPDELEELAESMERWHGRSGSPRGQVQRVRASDGTWREVYYDAVTGPRVAPFSIVVTIRAAEDADPVQGELVQRVLAEEILLRLTKTFLELPLERFDEGLDHALSALAALEWTTRISIWLVDDDRLVRRATWEAPANAPALRLPPRFRLASSPAMRALVSGDEIRFSREVPLADSAWAADRIVFEKSGVQSALAVPMMGGGRFTGALALESTIGDVAFDTTHTFTVRSAAAILGEAFVRNEAERRLADQARIDPVTGLGSRWAFDVALVRALEDVRTGTSPGCGLAIVDLDRFKMVNDALGHRAGDSLLADVATRLVGAAGARTLLARLGGDEILVLHEHEADAAGTIDRTRALLGALAAPFEIQGTRITLTASAGVVHAGDVSADAGELLRRADLAMYRAKALGGDHLEVDDADLREQVASRLGREAGLRAALADGRLIVHYQGEWDLGTGALIGAEALARWDHPVEGLLTAGSFIALAEDCGLINELGRFVLREACAAVAGWRSRGLDDGFVLRVNLAARQLRQPDLVDQVADALADAGLPASALCLELTESALLIDPDGSVAVLARLRELGVGLAVDDFGTGYSSLLYLKRLPLTALKIDRAFVMGLPDDRRDRAIVASTIQLADALGISATAEGVETEGQRQALVELGCRRAQGFLFARPEPFEVFAARVLTDGGV